MFGPILIGGAGGGAGEPGTPVFIDASETHIRWRYVGSFEWTNIVAIADLVGPSGSSIEIQKTATHIQTRPSGGAWTNLIALADIKGDPGTPADNARLATVEERVDDIDLTIVSVPKLRATDVEINVDAGGGEAAIRAAIEEGLSYWASPKSTIVVNIPEMGDVSVTSPIMLDTVEANRLFIKGPMRTLQPAPTSIVSSVFSSNSANGIPHYNVTFELAANHTLAVNHRVDLVARSTTGFPGGAWQDLAGFHQVVAVPAANRVTLRIPSFRSIAGVNTPLTGANSVTFSLHRVRTSLVAAPTFAPVVGPGNSILDLANSRLKGVSHLGFVGQYSNAVLGMTVRGAAASLACTGPLSFAGLDRGFSAVAASMAKIGGAPDVFSTDETFMVSGCNGHGLFVSNGSMIDGTELVSHAFNGNKLNGVYNFMSDLDLNQLGVVAGNFANGVGSSRRARTFYRPKDLYLPVAGNIAAGWAGPTGQIFAEILSYHDALGIDSSITLSPAANTDGNTNSYVLR